MAFLDAFKRYEAREESKKHTQTQGDAQDETRPSRPASEGSLNKKSLRVRRLNSYTILPTEFHSYVARAGFRKVARLSTHQIRLRDLLLQ